MKFISEDPDVNFDKQLSPLLLFIDIFGIRLVVKLSVLRWQHHPFDPHDAFIDKTIEYSV